ncbi:MAG: tetratricopeptide repeat protein, partial [Candidatus Aminicenantes bacterium]|nr:tetratricopeptide repeat protein [Candidatus Aminicenantes bacterium]
MSIRLLNVIHAGLCLPAMVVLITTAVAFRSTAQETPAEAVAVPPAPVIATPPPGTDITESEQHFRAGVDLYNRNHFLEALNEFNRALALDPANENARLFRDKAQAKLQIKSAGGEAGPATTFDVLDPESIPLGVETPQLSAEEMRIRAVRDLLAQGEVLLENQLYARAVPIFEQVLLIAPDNERARAGLHAATLGASEQSLKSSEERVTEDRAQI